MPLGCSPAIRLHERSRTLSCSDTSFLSFCFLSSLARSMAGLALVATAYERVRIAWRCTVMGGSWRLLFESSANRDSAIAVDVSLARHDERKSWCWAQRR